MSLQKGDTVELINQGAFKTNWGHVHRAAKNGAWADVILGQYACYRFQQDQLRKVAPRCKVCGLNVEVTSVDGMCMGCFAKLMQKLNVHMTGDLAEMQNQTQV